MNRKPKATRFVLLLLLLSLVCLGCGSVGHPPFRGEYCRDLVRVVDPGDSSHCFIDSGLERDAPTCSIEKKSGEEGEAYRLAYVEFTENGNYARACQLDRAIALLDEVNPGGSDRVGQAKGAVVVTFVHGWRNDASPGNEKRQGNLFHFKELLAGLAKRERESQQRPVIGIYVGWRGDSLSTRPSFLDLPTFWDRYNVAERIASSPVATQALLILLKTAQENPKSRSVVVGHSMGALLLERAVSQALVSSIIDGIYRAESPREQPTCRDGSAPECRDKSTPHVRHFRPPADLIVFVNSAAPAAQTDHFRQTLEIKPEITFNEGPLPGPLLLSITAENDTATKRAFPFGMWLANTGRHFAPEEQDEPAPRKLALHTAGHMKGLHSHERLDYDKGVSPCDGRTFGEGIVLCNENGVLPVGPWPERMSFMVGDQRYVLKSRPGYRSRVPYWILQAPKEMIDGHSKIFVPQFEDFLRGLIVVTGATDPRIEKTFTVAAQ